MMPNEHDDLFTDPVPNFVLLHYLCTSLIHRDHLKLKQELKINFVFHESMKLSIDSHPNVRSIQRDTHIIKNYKVMCNKMEDPLSEYKPGIHYSVSSRFSKIPPDNPLIYAYVVNVSVQQICHFDIIYHFTSPLNSIIVVGRRRLVDKIRGIESYGFQHFERDPRWELIMCCNSEVGLMDNSR